MITLSPNHRFAFIGKTRSGKTTAMVALAALLVPVDAPVWEVHWLDSKRDPRDQAMLREWGFNRRGSARKMFTLNGTPDEVVAQAQAHCLRALDQRNVLIVVDEYKHVTASPRRAGDGIEGVHLRGGGLNVGIMGGTQEPVDIPRQLLSQATHQFQFDLSYPTDIEYMRKFNRGFHRSRCDKHHGRSDECNASLGEPAAHAFDYAHIDGDARFVHYPHFRAFYDIVNATNQQKVSA